LSMKPALRLFPVLLLLALASATVPAFADTEGHFERTLSVSGPVDVTVQTGSGTVAVRRGDSGKVEIHGTIHASNHRDGADVEARIREIEAHPPIEQEGNKIRIGHFDEHERERHISISYVLTVPAESKVRTESGSGDQSIEGISGPVDASSGSGSLRLANIGNEARVRTGSGEITLSEIRGSVHATAGSGTIHATGIMGGLNASSGSGNIHLEQTATGDVEISTGSGEIEIRGVKGGVRASTGSGSIHAQGQPTGEWRLRSGSGNVAVEFPRGAAFDLAARSSSGNIETSHEIAVQGSLSSRELRGKVNGGGVLVDLSTSSGTIEVR